MATHQEAESRVQNGFWIHLAVYVSVVGGLAYLNYTRNPDHLWVMWVAAGWGLGIAVHAMAFFSQRGRERMVHRTEERMDRREERVAARQGTNLPSQAGR